MSQNENYYEHGLDKYGIENTGNVYWNLCTPALYEQVIRRREGLLAHLGPIVVRTGHHTGRSPNDKFIVKEPTSEEHIWWSDANKPFDIAKFDALYNRLLAYLQGKDLYIQDCYAGTDEKYRIPIRIITETAWHSLFARNMFIQIRQPEQLRTHVPRFTIIDAPRFHASPAIDGTNSEAFIIVNFNRQLILIGGTSYAGEIKKSVFTVLNYRLPHEQVLSMHCSSNMGVRNDVALFFGLSGTGKTALATDPERKLIGDDEHGWSDNGIFNFEGGCYAKVINLSPEAEPQIYQCTRRFGTILENVAINALTRRVDLNDATLTENTRAAYPITHIENSLFPGIAGQPTNIFMLTYDAFGVLPPISKLTPEQAIFQFLSGYTARVAGTETGIAKEPTATFSPCFGAPFMALHPSVYARLLSERITQHKVDCWLVNTGLTGGSYGTGQRIKIAYSRAMIKAALNNELSNSAMKIHPVFGLYYPASCPGVPPEILDAKNTWKDKQAYDQQASKLDALFRENYKKYAI